MNNPRVPDANEVRAFWSAYCSAAGVDGEPADVFCFGDSAEMADELGALVIDGTKRATAGSLVEYDADGFRPSVGDLSVVVGGDGAPVAVIKTVEVAVGPLTGVTDAFAWDEGEGDRTRESWIRGHQAFFRRSCARRGLPYDDDLQVVFERFEVLWPDG